MGYLEQTVNLICKEITRALGCYSAGAYLVCSELVSVCAEVLASPAEFEVMLAFVCFEVANSKTYCSMSASGYLFGPEP